MGSRSRFFVLGTTSLLILALLVGLASVRPPNLSQIFPILFFATLIVFATIFGVALGGGIASLLPMVSVAAYLVLGLTTVGWLAFFSALPHAAIRLRYGGRLGLPVPPERYALLALTAANATMHTLSILAAGAIYEAAGGRVPLTMPGEVKIAPLVILGLTYFLANHFIAGLYFRLVGSAQFRSHLREVPRLFLYEATPMIIAPLIALIYVQLGSGQLLVFGFVLVLLSLITHNLDQTGQRLSRRIQELNSLQVVGEALSASLDVDTVLSRIYAQVAKLMPSNVFYVALYDEESDEIDFAYVVEEGLFAQWPSRTAGNGLTEYVMRTRNSLLVRDDLAQTVRQLNVEPIILNREQTLAASWLGVPILAGGGKAVGVICVQSLSERDTYDASHRDILSAIAAQASVAIQNAQLYANTDTALAQRIQELDSILRTTDDGILLMDMEWRIVTANRAMAQFVNLYVRDIAGKRATVWPETGGSMLTRLGFTSEDLELAVSSLEKGESSIDEKVTLPGPPEWHAHRSLVAVRGRSGAAEGWLLILRDITEEIALSQLREDMTHMLVHDLRSPLSVIIGSLETGREWLNKGHAQEAEGALELARNSSGRMLWLLNDLLDVYRFEGGEVPILPTAVPVKYLFADLTSQFAPLISEANLTVETDVEQALPPLAVEHDHMGRVFQNLFDNALKFTPDGGVIKLWARLDSEAVPPNVLVGISDSGPGIPKEEHGKVFQKFQKGVDSRGRRPGTGLGLSYCKLVVEAHGGEIWIDNGEGNARGCTFVMRLPICNPDSLV